MKQILPKNITPFELQSVLQHSVAPRPIALASTVDKDGNVNVSPFSFFNMFSTNPPILIFSPLRKARGNMINKLMDEIRGGLNVPRMNPANVYDEDFNKFTLDNFVTGLTTDVVNDADNTIRGGLNTAGGF